MLVFFFLKIHSFNIICKWRYFLVSHSTNRCKLIDIVYPFGFFSCGHCVANPLSLTASDYLFGIFKLQTDYSTVYLIGHLE